MVLFLFFIVLYIRILMKEERIWQLVSLKFSGEATAGELAELHHLLQADPALSFTISQVEQIWKDSTYTPELSVEAAFKRHLQRLNHQSAGSSIEHKDADTGLGAEPKKSLLTRRIIRMSSIAAAAIIAIVLLYKVNFRKDKPASVAANIVATKPGSKSKISLPDGSQVWLNADSKITYYEDYGISVRAVELTGEAYFDVVKDKNRPFIIHTKSIEVKVLGTAFNVRSYPNEKTSVTSLIRGSVEITVNDNPGKKIILRPNEKLVVQNDQRRAADTQQDASVKDGPLLLLSQLHFVNGDSSSVETYWTKNKLAFEGETLENVAKKIERWYDVKVIITSDSLKSEIYTGIFEDDSLPEVMRALQLTGNFRYTIKKKEVVISP